MCLLHALCWCSVDTSASTGSASGWQKCLALEDDKIAVRLSTQCVEHVCSLVLEEHARSLLISSLPCARGSSMPTSLWTFLSSDASSVIAAMPCWCCRSRDLALHACGALMMIYRFRPQTDGRLKAVAAATAVLQAYGKDAQLTDPPDTGVETSESFPAFAQLSNKRLSLSTLADHLYSWRGESGSGRGGRRRAGWSAGAQYRPHR